MIEVNGKIIITIKLSSFDGCPETPFVTLSQQIDKKTNFYQKKKKR